MKRQKMKKKEGSLFANGKGNKKNLFGSEAGRVVTGLEWYLIG